MSGRACAGSARLLPLRATPAAARVHELRPGGLHARRLELLAVSEHGRDAADICLLLGQDECDPLSGAPGAAGPADAVDVALAVLRRVVVDHVADGVEFESPGGAGGGDERRHL